MLLSYLKVVLRQMQRQKGYTVLNVVGLGVGLACGFLLLLYVQHEWSYDRFHKKADRIFRVTSTSHMPHGEMTWAAVAEPVAPLLETTFAEIETTTRIRRSPHFVSRNTEHGFYEHNFFYADPTFFEIFDFEVLQGDPATALARPNTVLLTASAATKYFADTDPIGQMLHLDGQHTVEVTGILADPPRNSHLQFAILAPYSTPHGSTPDDDWADTAYTYTLLTANSNASALATKLPDFVENEITVPSIRAIGLLPLTDIWLRSKGITPIDASPQGNLRVVYLCAAIALIILLLACINYMNLATARSLRRSCEVGLRKIVGAHRSQLIYQFFSEALLLTGISLILALVLLEWLIPYANNLMEWSLELHYHAPSAWMLLGSITIGVALLAGSYPALCLSSFRPLVAFRQTGTSRHNRGIRSGLVVFQFAATLILVVSTVVIHQQLTYALTKTDGLSPDNLLVVPIASLGGQAEALRDRLGQESAVAHTTWAEGIPFSWVPTTTYAAEHIEAYSDTTDVLFQEFRMGADAVATLGLTLATGQSLAEGDLADPTRVLLNETAVRHLGWSDPLGKIIRHPTTGITYRVRGVVTDFHTQSVHQPIQPLLIMQADAPYRFLLVRAHAEALVQAAEALQAAWEHVLPNQQPNYFSYNYLLSFAYRGEARLRHLITLFTGLALGIAVLGLLGLATFTAEQRTKEMGIRKVFGASVPRVIMLLLQDVTQRMALAFLLAAPLAYIVMATWLSNFTYHIELGLPTLLLAGGGLLLLALLCVSYQALHTASRNPIETLRYE